MNTNSTDLYIKSIFPEQGLADPHALVDGDKVYVICGHDKSPYTDDTWVMDKWVILESSNLTDWDKVGEILPTDTYIGDLPNCWAGNFKKKGDKYYWFFSNRNLSTGVLVADSPKGPFKDVLGKPLITNEMSPYTAPYDPVVYIENDDYYIIVGAGNYYIAKLSDDLLSLDSDLTLINIKDENGNKVKTDDKPSFFKRNDLYYLVWGGKYAISSTLFGEYKFMGEYNPNSHEHNDFFVWNDEWYMVSEYPELTHYYRGVSLSSIHFNEDNTIQKPQTESLNEKEWLFELSTMGFHNMRDLTLSWCNCDEKHIHGEVSKENAMLQSTIWCGVLLDEVSTLEIVLKHSSKATKAKIIVAVEVGEGIMQNFQNPITDWDNQIVYSVDISENGNVFTKYTIDISKSADKKRLKRVGIMPISDADNGEFAISSISIK